MKASIRRPSGFSMWPDEPNMAQGTPMAGVVGYRLRMDLRSNPGSRTRNSSMSKKAIQSNSSA